MESALYKQIGQRIRLARENLELSQEKLAQMMGYTSPASISHFETGLRKISVADLQMLSEILGLPLDYFIREQVPEMQSFRLRAHGIRPSARDAVAAFLSFAHKNGEASPRILPGIYNGHRPGLVAKEILTRVQITEPPVSPKQAATRLNIPVFQWDFPDEVSGIFVFEQSKACIGVNLNHPYVRQRFSIAHELGHFVLHQEHDLFVDFIEVEMTDLSVDFDEQQRILETQANQFAADLLMPMDWVRRDFHEYGEDNLPFLASRYEVSEQALWFRLLNLKLVSPADQDPFAS